MASEAELHRLDAARVLMDRAKDLTYWSQKGERVWPPLPPYVRPLVVRCDRTGLVVTITQE